ncbi:MAG: ABC transporter ATP-binding protein [Deltaproteobacteria bacterium]|nr:ABC transporter ATP-binding protein [Deltaproteobacteria bacterium]MBW2087637.1 ABC transporter ATP-binding protein [Deltaproteobacteria bacterium]RLC07815.1 MAG: ABC transporter ATP-binding protein [Deltaproteobacteria bacterium]
MSCPGTDTIIRTKGLSVGYNKKTVLSLVDLAFEKGKFISLLGPNGSGKTTLLRTMARLLPPCDGSVLINQISLNEFRQDHLARILSVVLTDHVSPGLFSVFEFVALGRYPHTGFLGRLTKTDEKAVTASLSHVNAQDLIFRQIETLSDGEKQKILIARALAQEPRLILLDEPTIHLDLKHRMEVMSILQKLCREKEITVVASMHDVDIAAKISDHVVLIKDGGVIAWGSPEETLNKKSVAALYDFEGASFNPDLGSIEIKANGHRGSVFVVGGIGCGTVFYRLLAKRGFAVSTGVLHTNDLDYYVAMSLGAECITQSPMKKVTQNETNKARLSVRQADYIIDAGFPLGELNRMNTELIKYAIDHGKQVFTLRKTEDARQLIKTEPDNLFVCRNATLLLKKLEIWLKEKNQKLQGRRIEK